MPGTREEIVTMGLTVLPHRPYSPDLPPSDFHHFSPLKDGLRERRFSNDEEFHTA
jgi:histone-lysine N-methyltransferase SETMAR